MKKEVIVVDTLVNIFYSVVKVNDNASDSDILRQCKLFIKTIWMDTVLCNTGMMRNNRRLWRKILQILLAPE